MALEGRVKFIRKNGHIIPLKQPALTRKGKQDVNNAVKGATALAAGLATGAATGVVYGKTLRNGLALKARALTTIEKLKAYKVVQPRNLAHFAKKGENISKATKLSRDAFRASRAIGRLAPGVRMGGQLAASSLIGYGTGKLYKAARKDADPGEVASVAATASTGAFLAGAHGRAGVKGVIRDAAVAARPIFRRLKGKIRF